MLIPLYRLGFSETVGIILPAESQAGAYEMGQLPVVVKRKRM